eukprot:7196277-Prorocentrum_lima.AAC.1
MRASPFRSQERAADQDVQMVVPAMSSFEYQLGRWAATLGRRRSQEEAIDLPLGRWMATL